MRAARRGRRSSIGIGRVKAATNSRRALPADRSNWKCGRRSQQRLLQAVLQRLFRRVYFSHTTMDDSRPRRHTTEVLFEFVAGGEDPLTRAMTPEPALITMRGDIQG